MTENKPIIIDGVDVSTCSELGETINGITCGNGERIRLANEIITKHKLCKDSPNCVYKQLARKTQECEKLRESNDEKNEFLKKLDISATGEFYRIQYYIDRLYQACENWKETAGQYAKNEEYYRSQVDKLKAEEQYLKQCCIKAGEELAKHSFDWDGKEKNLVVQAMELNRKYEQAEQKFRRIKTLNPHTRTFMEYRAEIRRIIDGAEQ